MVDTRVAELDLSRQAMLIDPRGIHTLAIAIIGGGAIGSNVAYLLSKMGVSEGAIHLYDFDRVAAENLAPARFAAKSVGELKVYAIREGIQEELGVDTVVPYPVPYERSEEGEYDIVIACPDKMDVRRDVWDNPNLRWNWLIDGRMGGDQAEVYVIGPGRDGPGSRLYKDMIIIEDTELECGEKATAPVSAGMIPGFIGSAVANIANGQPPPIHMFFSMSTGFIAALKEDAA